MITTEQRAELRRLLDEATPGPWHWHQYMETAATLAHPNLPYHELNVLKTTDDWPPSEVDAALIVALRNNAEALLDAADAQGDLFPGEVEALRESRDRLLAHAEQAEAEKCPAACRGGAGGDGCLRRAVRWLRRWECSTWQDIRAALAGGDA